MCVTPLSVCFFPRSTVFPDRRRHHGLVMEVEANADDWAVDECRTVVGWEPQQTTRLANQATRPACRPLIEGIAGWSLFQSRRVRRTCPASFAVAKTDKVQATSYARLREAAQGQAPTRTIGVWGAGMHGRSLVSESVEPSCSNRWSAKWGVHTTCRKVAACLLLKQETHDSLSKAFSTLHPATLISSNVRIRNNTVSLLVSAVFSVTPLSF